MLKIISFIRDSEITTMSITIHVINVPLENFQEVWSTIRGQVAASSREFVAGVDQPAPPTYAAATTGRDDGEATTSARGDSRYSPRAPSLPSNSWTTPERAQEPASPDSWTAPPVRRILAADSPDSWASQEEQLAASPDSWTAPPLGQSLEAGSWTCLLYTSDAAAD